MTATRNVKKYFVDLEGLDKVEFTKTQGILMNEFKDGKPKKKEDLRLAIYDDLSEKTLLKHISDLRLKIAEYGYLITIKVRNRSHEYVLSRSIS